jgi:ABC-2 type transport system ATP-binding protein
LHLLGRVQGAADPAYRDDLVERFRLDPSKKVRAYSKGNRQKVLLVAALSSRADLLVLDEPTTGLDPLMEQVFRETVGDARARGQAVFLSSHILSEVEALSDRVAILRAGELVEVGTLAQMRHLSALSIEATFDAAPPDLSRVPGVTGLEVRGNDVRCQVVGSVEPLLGVLASSGVHQLLSREPSLEELFLVRDGVGPAVRRAGRQRDAQLPLRLPRRRLARALRRDDGRQPRTHRRDRPRALARHPGWLRGVADDEPDDRRRRHLGPAHRDPDAAG